MLKFLNLDFYIHAANTVNGVVVGTPQMTAYWGFYHALSRKVKESFGEDVTPHSFAVAMRDTTSHGPTKAPLIGGVTTKREFDDQGEKTLKVLKPASLFDNSKMSLYANITIMLIVDDYSDITDNDIIEFFEDELLGMRVSGGLIDNNELKVNIYDNFKDTLEDISGTYFFIEDESHNFNLLNREEKNDYIYNNVVKRKKFEFREKGEIIPYLFMNAIGYVFISEPTESIHFYDKKHVFSEQILTPCRARSKFSVQKNIRLDPDFRNKIFWMERKQDNAFFITTKNIEE